MNIDEFMMKISNVELSQNPISRVRLLAKETAQGAYEGVWGASNFINQQTYQEYLRRRWPNNRPDWGLLYQNGYFSHLPGGSEQIEKPAFDLVIETIPANVFISYRRKESSAFALLVLARLKEVDISPFLDMSLRPGDNWHAYIKEQIQQRDYFVILLGKETLNSDVVKQEIQWAIEGDAEIIPIWHNGFEYKEGEFDLPLDIQKVLRSNHSIRVLEESALAYNNAIVELLNRFGITP